MTEASDLKIYWTVSTVSLHITIVLSGVYKIFTDLPAELLVFVFSADATADVISGRIS